MVGTESRWDEKGVHLYRRLPLLMDPFNFSVLQFALQKSVNTMLSRAMVPFPSKSGFRYWFAAADVKLPWGTIDFQIQS